MRAGGFLALGIAAGLQVLAVVFLIRPAPPIQPALAMHWMSRLDDDGDGVLSIDEATDRSLPGAPDWDLDDDGVITPGELERMLWMLDPNVLYESAPGRQKQ